MRNISELADHARTTGRRLTAKSWPPSSWDESDFYRDEETRLPTVLYPFQIAPERDGSGRWSLSFNDRSGKPHRDLSTHDGIFPAFKAMVSAYEAWFPERPQPCVYFIGTELKIGRLVKVGYSVNPQARLGQLQTSNPEALCILATVPGTRDDEAKYHRRWRNYRQAGEWFRLADCILAEIARLNQGATA